MADQRPSIISVFVLLLVATSIPGSSSWEEYNQFWREAAQHPNAEELWKEHISQFQGNDQSLPQTTTFHCDTSESHRTPTSVHRLRPGDIKVVGALGDSLTAANGAEATDIAGCANEYRGVAWSVGGEGDLDTGVTTMPNVLRKYNPQLFGMSNGTGTVDNPVAGFDVAVPGSRAYNMPGQANDLVAKMKASPDVDIHRDWKMITLFVGGNDLCDYCGQKEKYSPRNYSLHIRHALDILQDELPRTFVNLVPMFDIGMVAKLGKGVLCKGLHLVICNCAVQEKNAEMLKRVVGRYNEGLKCLLASGRYETRDDFTVVLQPFMINTEVPKLPDGTTDMSYLSPDCFHFSKKGHGQAATMLWNNMIQPVGQKSTDMTFNSTLKCPRPDAFIPTARNSGLFGGQ